MGDAVASRSDEVFALRPPPPVRALAISAAAAVAGAVVIVLSRHSAVLLLGAILLGFGLLLALGALVLSARLCSTVRVTATELKVSRGRRRHRLPWTEIERVQERGQQLIVVARGEKPDLVITVPGPRGASYLRLLQAIKQHLDDSRGYGS
jgi:hypothetical protein